MSAILNPLLLAHSITHTNMTHIPSTWAHIKFSDVLRPYFLCRAENNKGKKRKKSNFTADMRNRFKVSELYLYKSHTKKH